MPKYRIHKGSSSNRLVTNKNSISPTPPLFIECVDGKYNFKDVMDTLKTDEIALEKNTKDSIESHHSAKKEEG